MSSGAARRSIFKSLVVFLLVLVHVWLVAEVFIEDDDARAILGGFCLATFYWVSLMFAGEKLLRSVVEGRGASKAMLLVGKTVVLLAFMGLALSHYEASRTFFVVGFAVMFFSIGCLLCLNVKKLAR